MRGDFTWAVRPVQRDQVRALAKQMDWHTPYLYDPLATIAAMRPPQLWVLAEDDIDAPSAETARRLAQLRLAGHPIMTVVWPHAEHGMSALPRLGADTIAAAQRVPIECGPVP